MSWNPKALALGFGCTLIVSIASDARGQEKTDLYSLVLIAADLYDAKQAMTRYDPNEDGFIDSVEQKRLSWKKDVSEFDLEQGRKLTHLELAVRQASLRDESDSTQADRNAARTWMRKKDRNGNGQLDPVEIASGWPDAPEDFDTDQDGIITMAEMAAQFAVRRNMRQEMGIEGIDQNGAIRLRDRFDKDKDGKLAPDEWAAAPLPLDGKEFDENEDKFLSVPEIATMLAKHRMDLGLTVSDQNGIARIFMSDFNRDGKISEKESENGLVFGGKPQDLSKYDSNRDGEITRAEVEKVFSDVRKERGYNAAHFNAAKKLLLRNDKNRSKYLEEDEFAEDPGPGQLAIKWFKSIDLNGDKRVGLDELSRHLAKQDK